MRWHMALAARGQPNGAVPSRWQLGMHAQIVNNLQWSIVDVTDLLYCLACLLMQNIWLMYRKPFIDLHERF